MQAREDILRGKKFKFWTQAGVFSKEKIDEGTKLLLANIEIKKGARILDLGCGYGAMGIVAASISEGKVFLVDSDIRAVRLAEKNLAENKIKDGEVKISDGFSDLGEEKFDLILTYPPSHEGKEIVEGFVKGASVRLNKNGKFYLVTEKRLKSYFERILKMNFRENKIIIENKSYVLFLAEN